MDKTAPHEMIRLIFARCCLYHLMALSVKNLILCGVAFGGLSGLPVIGVRGRSRISLFILVISNADDKLVIKSDVLRKYFPKSYTPQQMEAVIMKLLEQWMKKRSREQER